MSKFYHKFNSLLPDMYTEEELESTIINYKNKLNDINLINLISYDIDYLSELDYVDLQNICKINKNINICSHDMILRNILFKTYHDTLLKNS